MEPTFFYAPGPGIISSRSGWGVDDTQVLFSAGALLESHQDRAAGEFLLYRGDWLAAEAKLLSASGLAQDAIDHNCLTVDGRNQTFGETTARITAQVDTPAYTYLAADLAPAYVGQLVTYVRELFFLKPNYLFVRDSYTPVNSGDAVVSHLHTLDGPAVANGALVAGRLFGTIVAGGTPVVVGSQAPYRIDVPLSGGGLLALEAGAAGQFLRTLGTPVNGGGVQGIAAGNRFVGWLTGAGPWSYVCPVTGTQWLAGLAPNTVYQDSMGSLTSNAFGIVLFPALAGQTVTISQQGGGPVGITFGGYRDGRRNPTTSIQAGQTLLIEGAGFGATRGVVTLGGNFAQVNTWSDTEIAVTVPNLGGLTAPGLVAVNGIADPYPLLVLPPLPLPPPPPPPGGTYAVSGTLTKQADGSLTGSVVLKPQ